MTSTPSGDVVIDKDLCDIMLQPVREVRGARKRQKNKDLDPGNQCIMGKVFLEAINSEKERKKKESARSAEDKKWKLKEKKKKERKKGSRERTNK